MKLLQSRIQLSFWRKIQVRKQWCQWCWFVESNLVATWILVFSRLQNTVHSVEFFTKYNFSWWLVRLDAVFFNCSTSQHLYWPSCFLWVIHDIDSYLYNNVVLCCGNPGDIDELSHSRNHSADLLFLQNNQAWIKNSKKRFHYIHFPPQQNCCFISHEQSS